MTVCKNCDSLIKRESQNVKHAILEVRLIDAVIFLPGDDEDEDDDDMDDDDLEMPDDFDDEDEDEVSCFSSS